MTNPYRVEGTTLISGAANGIGRATALAMAAAGSRLILFDKEVQALEEVASQARALGSDVHSASLDCCLPDDLAAAYDLAVERMGPVDVLFNNVGQSAREKASLFVDSSEEVWRFVLETSLLVTMRLSRLVAPAMRERGGRIINMSTVSAFSGDTGLADYAAAKMGVIGFTRVLARELAPHQINVNAVAPGAIRTRAHDCLPGEVIERIKGSVPLGYVGDPEDVANVVVFLASPASRYITGQTLLIDGGYWMN